MLLSMTIADFAIVDRIDVEFAAGMTVLTGETGAGKSILVDALGLVLGERGGSGRCLAEGQNGQVDDWVELSARQQRGKRAEVDDVHGEGE